MESNGQRLKKMRLEKGLSLEEVQKKTKVHLNILKAIEGDSVSNLSPIYLKSFIKIYCSFLGVPYKDYIVEDRECKPAPKELVPPKEGGKFYETAKPSYLDSKPMSLGPSRAGTAIKLGVIIVISLSILVFIFFLLGKFIASRHAVVSVRKKPAKVNVAKREVKKIKPAQEARIPASTPKLQEIPLRPRKEAVTSILLGIRVREDCFVHLKVDGKVVFHRNLEKGRFESWEGKDRMELSVGNAGAVELEVNGQLFSKIGRRGESKKGILVTREGVTIP